MTSNEDLLLQHEEEMQALAITRLQMKVSMLEDLNDLIQDIIKNEITRWKSNMEITFKKKLGTYLTKMNLIKQESGLCCQ